MREEALGDGQTPRLLQRRAHLRTPAPADSLPYVARADRLLDDRAAAGGAQLEHDRSKLIAHVARELERAHAEVARMHARAPL